MKTTFFILIIASLLQTTIIPINLVLIILICRSFLSQEKSNLFLAFIFGLFIGHLSLNNLGFQSMIYLILVQFAQIISVTRFSIHSILIVPLTYLLLFLNMLMLSLIDHQSIQISVKFIIEGMLSLPVFYLEKFWSERFIVQKNIKLRL